MTILEYKKEMKRMKNYYFLLNVVIILILFGCQEKSEQKPLGQAVSFRLMDTDSTYRQLEEFKGRIIMLHFWADWCPHCRQEFPELQNAYNALKDRGFLIVGINSGQPYEHVIGIQQEFNLTFPMLVDEAAGVAKKYNVAGLPASFFIDVQGNILASEVGWAKEDKIIEIFDRLTESS